MFVALGCAATFVVGAAGTTARAATLDPHCVSQPGIVTCSFYHTGGEDVFIVPPHQAIKVRAVGAMGGGAYGTGPGGGPQVAESAVPYAVGTKLFIHVGGEPTIGPGCKWLIPCVGGYNGGGSTFDVGAFGIPGGAGGGASDVSTASENEGDIYRLKTRFVIGAGGGGGGADVHLPGGAGGAGGQPGQKGTLCRGDSGALGGLAGAGALGYGESMHSNALAGGGAGGGGWYGGGAGESPVQGPNPDCIGQSGGGGGGGGTSYGDLIYAWTPGTATSFVQFTYIPA